MHNHQQSTPPRPQTAFTLVEVLLATTILLMAGVGVMTSFTGALKSSRSITDAIDVNARSRFIQERLLFDLRAITSVTATGTAMTATDVAKIFAGAGGDEVKNCFHTFTAKVNEYNGGDDVAVTYAIIADGKKPNGKVLYALQRTAGGESRKVLTRLEEGCFTFYKRTKSTGALVSLAAGDLAEINAIRFAFLPQGRGPLLPGQNDPSCSAVIQLRVPSYK